MVPRQPLPDLAYSYRTHADSTPPTHVDDDSGESGGEESEGGDTEDGAPSITGAPNYRKGPGRPTSTKSGKCPLCHYCAVGKSRGPVLAAHVNTKHRPWPIQGEHRTHLQRECGLKECHTCAHWVSGTPKQHRKQCDKNMNDIKLYRDAQLQGGSPDDKAQTGAAPPRHTPVPVEKFLESKVLCVRTLPISQRPGWQSRFRGDVAARVRHAKPEERMNLLEKTLGLVRAALPAPHRRLNKHQRKAHTAATLLGDTSKAVERETTETRPPLDPTVAAVLRAVVATRQAAIGKAIRTLAETSKVAPRTEETAAKIERLHPREPEGKIPPRPTGQYFTVRADVIRTVVRAYMSRGSAPGLDGWTRELMLPLVDDPVCLQGLTMMIEDIINGNISEWAREVLTASEVCPFVKPNGGIRPIAPESALMKLACLVVLVSIAPQIPNILSPEQHGVGHPGGPEAAAHRIRAAILRSQEDTAIDMENAYNCMYRHTMLATLYDTPELTPIWGLAHTLYGTPSAIYFYGSDGSILRKMESSRGVRQGCVLAPLLFALGLDGAIRKLATANPKDSITAYLDDVHAAVPWGTLKASYAVFVADCGDVGLTVNSKKTEHLAPEESVDHATLSMCIRVLGSVAGCDNPTSGTPVGNNGATQAMIEFCNNIARNNSMLFQNLAHPQLPRHIAEKLLRVCVGPRMNFILRSTPEPLTRECAGIFDGMYETCARHLYGDDAFDDQVTKSLLHLPFRVSGNGLRLSQLVQRYAYGTSCPEGTPGHMKGSQAEYTEKAEDEAFLALQLEGNRRAIALSACGPQGSAIYRTGGDDLVDDITPDAYMGGLRSRVGLVPVENMRWTCDCPQEGMTAHDHAMCCKYTKGDARRTRHDMIKDSIVAALKAAGFQVAAEPENYDKLSAKRPDIVVRVGSTWHAVEVSVTHPLGKTMRAAASMRQGAAVEAKVAAKHRKYDEMCARKEPKHILTVCAVETFGLVSGEFSRFVRYAERVSRRTSLAMEGWADRLFEQVSRSLHQGNLEVWQQYVARGTKRLVD